MDGDMIGRKIFKQPQRSRRHQSGSVPLFFVTVMLPALCFLLSLSLDVGTYFNERASTQKALDDAAVYAYRFLPYQSQATAAANQYLSRLGSMSSGVTASFTADGVQLRASRTFPLLFATIVGLQGAGLPLEVISRVRGVPFDVYISLDTTASVVPPPTGALSDPVNAWPGANYFSAQRFGLAGTSPDGRRALTQQCFNSVFSGLKLSAIQLLDYLGAFSLNAVGVGIDNGNAFNPLELIRSVRVSLPLPQNDVANRDAQFPQFQNGQVASADCAAVAQSELDPLQYRFPGFDAGLPPRGDFTLRPLTLIDPATRNLNPQYLPYLQAREVLWSQVARGASSGSTATLISNSFGEILTAAPVLGRGGLIASAKKVLIVLASDLPRQGAVTFATGGDAAGIALQQALTSSIFPYAATATSARASGRVELLYVLLQSPSTPNRSAGAAALQSFFDAQRAAAGLSQEQFNARVIYVTDPNVLLQQVLGALALINKTAVVSL
ncbi:MAG: hypothetical protein EBZ48_10660 [Proteobacteria bacterium]|nr:hypothetical protein [Pseudomonadota bacterium]